MANLTINQIVDKTGKSRCWVHRAIKSGNLETARKEIIPGTEIPRWIVDEDEAIKYFSGSSTRRDDNRRKMIVYAAAGDEMKALFAAAKKAGFLVEFAYKAPGSEAAEA